jgi:hypothetical protein
VAFLTRRGDDRIEIRETRRTDAGPRARSLASFRGALTPEVLDIAESRAAGAFDRQLLLQRASALGIPVTTKRPSRPVRDLLGLLHRGVGFDPTLLAALRDAIDRAGAAGLPVALREVAEWIGSTDRQRGEALRGLLRVSDRIVASRAPVREKPYTPYPRFHSRPSERG